MERISRWHDNLVTVRCVGCLSRVPLVCVLRHLPNGNLGHVSAGLFPTETLLNHGQPVEVREGDHCGRESKGWTVMMLIVFLFTCLSLCLCVCDAFFPPPVSPSSLIWQLSSRLITMWLYIDASLSTIITVYNYKDESEI